MWEYRIQAEVGRRSHELIAIAVESDIAVDDVARMVRNHLKDSPLGTTMRSSIRMRLTTAVASYLVRHRPVAAWECIGTEVRLATGGRADLVWRHKLDGCVVIDELKSRSSSAATPQIQRLVDGGTAAWGGKFLGVRVVPILSSGSVTFVSAAGRVPVGFGVNP